jgi:ATP-dependent DNA ligase
VVVDGGDGLASFERLRTGGVQRTDAFVWAFDLLELYGQDLRRESLERRKDALARLLKGAPFGLALNDHHVGDGPALFAEACKYGPGGHRVEAAHVALSLRPLARLAEGEESGQPGVAS